MQYELALISHKVDGSVVEQRAADGYVNATAMCQAAGKAFNDYRRLSATQAFIEQLVAETGIPVSELIQIVKGGRPESQGSWVHPMVAINLGQWVSGKFAVAVSKWVLEWKAGANSRKRLPYHLRRYMHNAPNVPIGHFSMLNESPFWYVFCALHRGGSYMELICQS